MIVEPAALTVEEITGIALGTVAVVAVIAVIMAVVIVIVVVVVRRHGIRITVSILTAACAAHSVHSSSCGLSVRLNIFVLITPACTAI